MAKEDAFVAHALRVASSHLVDPLFIERGVPLLYQVPVDNNLAITIDVKKPVRGKSSFETDLCILEQKPESVLIPRVVLEFKTDITTHDVITYSLKAEKHKQIYPYLRYGIIASQIDKIPGRVFTHNKALDFFGGVKGMLEGQLDDFFKELISAEVETSRKLESIFFGSPSIRLYRTSVNLQMLP